MDRGKYLSAAAKSWGAAIGAKSIFVGLTLAGMISAAAGAARAGDDGHVYLTEQDDVLSYDLSLFGFVATGTATPAGGGDHWEIGSGDGPLPFVAPFALSDGGDTEQYYDIAWREPGSDLYNVLVWQANGNRGTTVLSILSDAPASGHNFIFDYSLGSDCGLPSPGGPTACPILSDNQAFTFADEGVANSTLFLGNVTVRFNDLGDTSDTGSGVPEPAAWALMLSGFGLAGAALRRRRLGQSIRTGPCDI